MGSSRQVRSRREIGIFGGTSCSDDESTRGSLCKASLPCDSQSYREGCLQSLDNSQASLNKRLASVAGLDEQNPPADFRFLLEHGFGADDSRGEQGRQAAGVVTTEPGSEVDRARGSDLNEYSADLEEIEPASFQAVVDVLASVEPPASFSDDGLYWVSSGIRKSSELVDGQAWIKEFQRRFEKARAERRNAAMRDQALRNRVLKDMSSVSPPGRKVSLPTGQEVIFWFNVGALGPPRSRVYVTEASCPHQGVCLLQGELMEIEDLSLGVRALTRCPRHNKRFDLCTGKSPGNVEQLRRFPCRFEHGCWYVGVGPAVDGADAKPSELAGASGGNDSRAARKKARVALASNDGKSL